MVPLQSGKYTNNIQLWHSWKVNIYNYQIEKELFHCRQRALVENVLSTSGKLQSGIMLKKFDGYAVYDVLNCDAFFFI
jgi:hypothetical protein